MNAALEWITGRDTGMSSIALWSHMMTGKSDGSYPHDAADFGRIQRLLDIVPEWKPRVREMACYGREWLALTMYWPTLEQAYRAWWATRHESRERSRATYLVFREALGEAYDEFVRCARCDTPLRGSWTTIDGARHCLACESVRGAA